MVNFIALPSEFMDHKDLLRFQLYSDTKEFKALVKSTIRNIKQIYNNRRLNINNPYVAVSGGKDSMAMLHLVQQVIPDVWVRHWDYGRALVPGPFEQEILEGIGSMVEPDRICTELRPGGNNLSARNSDVISSGFFKYLPAAIQKHGWGHCFLGIRASESNRRNSRIIAAGRNRPNGVEPGYNGLTITSFPVQGWTGRDVWSYVVSNDISVPSVYKQLAKIHGSYEDARFVTFFDHEYEGLGSVTTSNVYFSEFKFDIDQIDVEYCCP